MFPLPRVLEPLPGTVDTTDWRGADDLRPHAVIRDDFRSSEAYTLHLSESRKQIELGGEPALRHAWSTLESWRADAPARTPAVHLEDAPEFPVRGFMLDISRCKVPTRDSLARWVAWLAAFRFNHLQLYTEHTFAYSGHEDVWAEASPLTPDDIDWLQALCRAHGIELVANQNTFGHFERWIAHPAYRDYAESPDGFTTPWGGRRAVGSVLKPDAASLRLVTGLLDELLPRFDSPFVNIGCDETFELGQGASRDRCRREGLGKVYTDFVTAIMDHVERRFGKRCMFWGDILLNHPEQISRLPGDAVALEWGYEADHPFARDARRFAEAGLDFLLCPGTSSWRSFAGRTENMAANISAAARHARDEGARGLLLADWGDCGHLQLEEVSAPALAWCGLQAWNPRTADWTDALAWSDQVVFGGQSGDTAAWADLGRAGTALDWTPSNSNAFFHLFRNRPADHARLRAIPRSALERTLDELDELRPPAPPREGWQHTRDNLRLALLREIDRRDGTRRARSLEARALATHERLWRQRNREGGLAESLSMYTDTRNPDPGESP